MSIPLPPLSSFFFFLIFTDHLCAWSNKRPHDPTHRKVRASVRIDQSMPGYQTTPLSQWLNITGLFYKCFLANEGLLCSAPQNLSGAQGDRIHHLIAALVTAAGKETAGGGQAPPTHPASPEIESWHFCWHYTGQIQSQGPGRVCRKTDGYSQTLKAVTTLGKTPHLILFCSLTNLYSIRHQARPWECGDTRAAQPEGHHSHCVLYESAPWSCAMQELCLCFSGSVLFYHEYPFSPAEETLSKGRDGT